MSNLAKSDLAKYIDHTLLRTTATETDIQNLCEEANRFHFASVCINPIFVKCATDCLRAMGSTVKVCTVIGFPLGSSTTDTKVFETKNAIDNGATEIDMVISVGMLKARNDEYVQDEIRRIHNVCTDHGALLKVIIEICYLTDEEITRASELAFAGGAEYVKTSTGFGPGNATLEGVQRMKQVAKQHQGKVKAAGGIRSYEDAIRMIEAGAYPYILPLSSFLTHY